MENKIIKRPFDLTKAEKELFDLLLEVQSQYCPHIILRVAGGWVRDKMLGGIGNDIDIALNCMGSEFAEKVNQHLVKIGKETHTICVIKSNPELHKHLETTSLKIISTSVDLVNLRSSSYTKVGEKTIIGTPQEDCLYRDLTINSLFYNINTDMVEDWSGMGIEDLKNKHIRTPIAPEETFRDDPLRMLRTLRFSVRFNFTISETTQDAIKRDDLKLILKTVSPERIGKELQGMLKSDNMDKVFNYIVNFGLIDSIFACPADIEVNTHDKENCILYLKTFLSLLPLISLPGIGPEDMRMVTLSAFLIPYAKYFYHKKQKQYPLIHYILTKSIMFTKKETDTVMILLTSFSKWKNIIDDTNNNQFNRKDTGFILIETKSLWLASMSLAFVNEAVTLKKDLPSIVNEWKLLKSQIESHNLINIWNEKLLLNGKEIMQLLKIDKGGEIVGKIKDELLKWQLVNPSANKEDCQQWLLQSKFQ